MRALAVEALNLLDSPRDINLAQTVLPLADNSGDEALSYDLEWHCELTGETTCSDRPRAGPHSRAISPSLLFSRPLQAAHRVDYRELITLSPRPSVEHYVVGNGRELCIVGAGFGETYDITVREGLKSAGGTRMRESVTLSLQTPDAPRKWPCPVRATCCRLQQPAGAAGNGELRADHGRALSPR